MWPALSPRLGTVLGLVGGPGRPFILLVAGAPTLVTAIIVHDAVLLPWLHSTGAGREYTCWGDSGSSMLTIIIELPKLHNPKSPDPTSRHDQRRVPHSDFRSNIPSQLSPKHYHCQEKRQMNRSPKHQTIHETRQIHHDSKCIMQQSNSPNPRRESRSDMTLGAFTKF